MIDHYKLIDLLSDRLRVEIKTAGNDLLEILEQLHRTLKESGKANFPGLGTFYMDGNQVMFEPDSQLVMDINFRYHGLQPIVLEVADRVMDSSDSEAHEIPETAVFVIDEPMVPSTIEDQSSRTEPKMSVILDDLIHDPAADIPLEALTGHDEPDTSPEPEAVLDQEPTHNTIATKGRTLTTPPLSRHSPHTIPINIKIDNDYIHKGQRWRSLVGVIVISLIMLAGVGVSWYNGWLAGAGVPSFHEVFPEYVTRNDPGSITIESPTIVRERVQEQEQEQGQEQEQAQGLGLVQGSEAEPVVVGSFGLMGTWQQELVGYFTIVSATMFTERVANEILDEVYADNKRARLFRVRVQGEIAWELHLGQFDTREAAREANATMDRKFQSDVVRQYGQQ